MKKALNAFAVALTLLAVIGLASPVFACGNKNKSKKGTTASKTDKDQSDKADEKAESEDQDDSKEEKSESPTKS